MFLKSFVSRSQRGQALVLIALAIVGLLGMTALAVDSANVYAGRRKAQLSSDNAALAGALAYVNKQDVTANALRVFNTEYTTEQVTEMDISVDVQNPPAEDCSGNIPDPVNHSNPLDKFDYYVQVVVHTTTPTYFGPIIGVTQVHNCVSAIARAKPELIVPPFNGNAVVGLDPNGKSFHAHSNAQEWHVRGGGIFANNNAEDDHGNVEFPDGDCVTAVGTTSGFSSDVCKHPGSTDEAYNYPGDIADLMPPTPECDGTAYSSGGKIHPQTGYEERGSVWSGGFEGDYLPGLYCITNADGNIHSGVTGTDVTFYILDTDFTMKYNGGGYFGASAPTSGKWKGLLMFGPITDTPCTQNIDIRGNGSTPIQGTVWMPSACIDWRGNGLGNADRSMIVGYDVTSNGNADVNIQYNPDDNYKAPQPPEIELTR